LPGLAGSIRQQPSSRAALRQKQHHVAIPAAGGYHTRDQWTPRSARVATRQPLVAMTFEMAWPRIRATGAPSAAGRLKARIMPRNFLAGHRPKWLVLANPQLMARMVAEGHEIGNHHLRHPTLSAAWHREHPNARWTARHTCGVSRPSSGKVPPTSRKCAPPPYGSIQR